MRIERLYAEKIGVFDELDITFPKKTVSDKAEIHILTGPNGSGKSTILYMLASFFGYQDGAFKRFRSIDSFCEIQAEGIIVRNQLSENEQKSKLEEKRMMYLIECAEHKKNISKVNYLRFVDSKNPIYSYYRHVQKYQVNNKLQENAFDFVVLSYSGSREVSSVQIAGINELVNNPFEDALTFQHSTKPQYIVQWIANTITKIALAKSKGDKKRAKVLESNLSKITQAVEEISGYEIEFELEDSPLNVVLKMHGEKIEFDVLPDGLKSIISWIADLLMRMDRIRWVDERDIFEREFILFLDEVDIHLHPSWQRKILPVVQKLFVNAQIFVSTHSPFVVASVDQAFIYKLEVENGVSRLIGSEEAKTGFSYQYILDEVFGIDEEFDVETEKQFKKFYSLKEALLAGDEAQEKEFLDSAKELAEKSIEVKDIVSREIRQLSRINHKDYAL